MRKKTQLIVAVAAAVSAAFAGTANADTSAAGCQAYGAFVSNTVQALNGAQPGGGGAFISGIATSGPGAVAGTATYLKGVTC
jgi:hypothetical protein